MLQTPTNCFHAKQRYKKKQSCALRNFMSENIMRWISNFQQMFKYSLEPDVLGRNRLTSGRCTTWYLWVKSDSKYNEEKNIICTSERLESIVRQSKENIIRFVEGNKNTSKYFVRFFFTLKNKMNRRAIHQTKVNSWGFYWLDGPTRFLMTQISSNFI